MSSSVIGQNQARSINAPQTPQEHSRFQTRGLTGVKTKMKSIQDPPATHNPVPDSRPAFSAWWERWRESRTR